MVEYVYETWGQFAVSYGSMAATLGELNPFRYRGYYYDTESGLYYLNSRYYDPEIGRWISPDSVATILEHMDDSIFATNLYAYCLNNPVNYYDPTGEFAITILAIAGVTLLWGVTTAVCIYAVNTPQFQEGWKNLCMGISNGMQTLVEQHKRNTVVLASKFNEVTQTVAKSFEKAKTKQYRVPTEVHHIVAQSAPKAYLARGILTDVGISVNSLFNLVPLKTGLHRRLHTDIYYGYVNAVISAAYHRGGDRTQQKQNVINALFDIRTKLKALDSISPF